MSRNMRIAVVGGGLGGLAAAILLQRAGYNVHVYEQTPSLARLGAGIHLGPNAVRILFRLGIQDDLCRIGVEPDAWVSRLWDTGEELYSQPLGGSGQRYGAPYLTVHRGDLHAMMVSALPPDCISFGKRLAGFEQTSGDVRMRFEDGTSAIADVLVGADGLNSVVREVLLGPEPPRFTGVVGHRALFPASLLEDYKLADCTKWWADDRHVIVYYVTRTRDEVYLVTGAPEKEWTSPASWVPCSKDELRGCFEGFHPEVQKLISLAPEDGITKWAFFERDPLPLWSNGRVVMLGDACHPMKPHMGQGAAMAIEDAAMLFRCFEEAGVADYRSAFALYEANRKDRTTRVQTTSRSNRWLREPTDPSWVFAYDAFTEPLLAPQQTPVG